MTYICVLICVHLVNCNFYQDHLSVFDLFQSHDKVLSLLNSQLSQYVSKIGSDNNSPRNRLLKLSEEISARLDGRELRCYPNTLNTFNMVRVLVEFFDYYHMREYEKALDVSGYLSVILPTKLN